MKILILGCGSIGNRHARNLKSLGIKEIILCDKDHRRLKSLGNEIGTKLLYTDFKKAVKEHPKISAAIICTPSAYHITPAIYFAKNRINLFIEKPLSNTMNNVKFFSETVRKNKLIVMIGHSLMFEEGFVIIKSLLEKNTIGKVYFVTYPQGQFLPDWHPYADYRVEYSARKEFGGGALLTLTSHTFYVIEWLFGKIKSLHGSIIDRVGTLEINVDDCALLLLKTTENVIVQTLNNFTARIPHHKIMIEGKTGRLEFDFVEKKVTVIQLNKKPKVIQTTKDNNKRFLKEMKYFITQLDQKNLDENLSIQSGIRFLEMIKKLNFKPRVIYK